MDKIKWCKRAVTLTKLPFDVARCQGKNAPLCRKCRRREPGRQTEQNMIAPALTLDGCENFIGHSSFLDEQTVSGGLVDEISAGEVHRA